MSGKTVFISYSHDSDQHRDKVLSKLYEQNLEIKERALGASTPTLVSPSGAAQVSRLLLTSDKHPSF